MANEALSIVDTTYSGTASSFYITRSVVDCETVKKGAVMMKDGIRKQYTIKRVEVENFIQDRQATPNSFGSAEVTGRQINPQDYMLYFEFNPRDFEQHWDAEDLDAKLLARVLPVTFQNYMIMQTMKRLNEFHEYGIWRSHKAFNVKNANFVAPENYGYQPNDTNYRYFDGLMSDIIGSASEAVPVITVPSTAFSGIPTASNIRPIMRDMIKRLPPALLGRYGKDGVRFFMSRVDFEIYSEALETDSFKNTFANNLPYEQYKGYDIVTLKGIPVGTILLTVAKPDIDSNFWVGINSFADYNPQIDGNDGVLQLQKLQNNSELYFLKGLFKMDTQIGFPDQIVFYNGAGLTI